MALSSAQVGTPAAANSIARLEGTNPDAFEAGKEVVVAFEARDAFGNTVSALVTSSIVLFGRTHQALRTLSHCQLWFAAV